MTFFELVARRTRAAQTSILLATALMLGAGVARAAIVVADIDMEKTTNGPTNANPIAPDYDNEDAANGVGVPILTIGSMVTWTYKVTNTGSVAFTSAMIEIVDDAGTPGNGADDLSTTGGQITFLSVSVGDADNQLESGEVWLYRANGTVVMGPYENEATVTADAVSDSDLSHYRNPVPPTATPTITATVTPTYTATLTPTDTPTATPSSSPSPTATLAPSEDAGGAIFCDDGVDNDGDGATDCADSDCADIAPCGAPVPAASGSTLAALVIAMLLVGAAAFRADKLILDRE